MKLRYRFHPKKGHGVGKKSHSTAPASLKQMLLDVLPEQDLIDLYMPTERETAALFQTAMNLTNDGLWPDSAIFEDEMKERLQFELRDRVYDALRRQKSHTNIAKVRKDIMDREAEDISRAVFTQVLAEYLAGKARSPQNNEANTASDINIFS